MVTLAELSFVEFDVNIDIIRRFPLFHWIFLLHRTSLIPMKTLSICIGSFAEPRQNEWRLSESANHETGPMS